MNIHSSIRWFPFFGMMIFIPFFSTASLPQQGTNMVNDLFSKTKPHCVGVYIVDVPESFENRTQKASYDDFSIESQLIYPPAFKQRIELREQALRTQRVSQKNAPALKEIIQLPNNQGVIFDKNQSGSDDIYRQLEAHIYLNHIAFIITTDFRDFSDKKHEKRKSQYLARGFTEVQSNQKPIKLATMRSLISRLQGRLDHEIPTAKGVCIPNGFIAEDGGKHEIVTGLSYENDDFLLTIHMDNKVKAGNKKQFNRDKEVKESLKRSYLKFVKKDEVKPNGIPAETWFLKGNQHYDKKTMDVYKFNLYANEDIASLQYPWVTIGFNSQYKQTRYSEAQMVEIWDRIVGSLRYKPNAF